MRSGPSAPTVRDVQLITDNGKWRELNICLRLRELYYMHTILDAHMLFIVFGNIYPTINEMSTVLNLWNLVLKNSN